MPPPAGMRGPMRIGRGPVSYTHLDVYKRQADKSEPDFKGRIFAFALLKYSQIR